jgi:HAD superfamily hydrolase (TIGR01459 family)
MPRSVPHASPGAGWAMRISSLSQIADQFDAMIIDQFGVIHDGRSLYPGTRNVLRELKSRAIRVAVMTNSGKRTAANLERLLSLGLWRDDFDAVISSGEVAYHRYKSKRAFLIGKAGEDYGFEGVTFVEQFKDAEVILILGTNYPATSLDDYRRLFTGVTLPAVCCNPDRLMLTPEGLAPAPGAIAALYEEMGGEVCWIGKPYPEIYRRALDLLPPARRVLCIGDSAEHDVAGGRAAGLSTLLIMTGVSAGLDSRTLTPQPDYVASTFDW